MFGARERVTPVGCRGASKVPGNLAGRSAIQAPKANEREVRVDFQCCGDELAVEERAAEGPASARPSQAEIEQAVRVLIRAAGDDPAREGLRDTPARVARGYREWFAGYAVDPAALLTRTFGEAENYEETILLRDIPLVSTCEHHLAPIIGRAHIAYRPDRRVVGISKLSRLVDAFARRLQLQERLTIQIAQTLEAELRPKGVAVVIEARHGCMTTRGVNQRGVAMVTKSWLGDFKRDAILRQEVMASIARRSMD